MASQNIPLIFVHNNNKFYLKLVLRQAYYFNKETPIYLLGDEANDKYSFVQHHLSSDYKQSANEFEKVYQHMTSNMYSYEIFCFQRWFIINDFVKKHNIGHFVCLDSDVLLFCNISNVFSEYINYDFTISETHCPCYTLFSSETLDRFCSFLMELYTNPFYLNILKERYEEIQAKGEIGGNSDMTAFYLYQKYISSNVKELTDIENDECFDGNINDYRGFEKNERDQKKVYWEDNRPYFVQEGTGKKVFVRGMHFQGNSKLDMYRYLIDKNLKRSFFFEIYILLSVGLRSKYRRYKVDSRNRYK